MRDLIANSNPDAIVLEGHDNAIIGVGSSFGMSDRAVYSVPAILENLKEMGMTEEEAEEYFDFNILCAYAGEDMPIYVYT